ncbi:MAG: hydantoinase/oxoprolinase family protein [Calditrichia bacterium]
MIRLGIDVGGTHTDGVVVENGRILKFQKVKTRHEDLLASVMEVLELILEGIPPTEIRQLNLSTTLSTNALLEGKTEPVGVLVSAGPGIHPRFFRIGDYYEIIPGSIDHRGIEIVKPDERKLAEALEKFRSDGVRVFAVAGKFSPRNPEHEHFITERLRPQADFITVGHTLSGQLNFPRRIATAYFNSAVWRIHNRFADAVLKNLQTFGLKCSVQILKADGGTMPLEISRQVPVQSILSGPAASIMGILALHRISEDALVLDVGGTSTDMALFAAGTPLLEREGTSLQGNATLVRSLQTTSVAVGGDSAIQIRDGIIQVGPRRAGPAMAGGGIQPTLTDALNFLGHSQFGTVSASLEGIRKISQENSLPPEKLAAEVVRIAVEKIRAAAAALQEMVNQKPVYTIHEMLHPHPVVAKKIYIMGGAAQALAPFIESRFRLPVMVSSHASVANAIGAALTRPTVELELYADTARKRLVIPKLSLQQETPPGFNLESAKDSARQFLREYVEQNHLQIETGTMEIVEADSFNMVEGFVTTGQNIRVKCQIKPGLAETIHE